MKWRNIDCKIVLWRLYSNEKSTFPLKWSAPHQLVSCAQWIHGANLAQSFLNFFAKYSSLDDESVNEFLLFKPEAYLLFLWLKEIWSARIQAQQREHKDRIEPTTGHALLAAFCYILQHALLATCPAKCFIEIRSTPHSDHRSVAYGMQLSTAVSVVASEPRPERERLNWHHRKFRTNMLPTSMYAKQLRSSRG